MEQKINQIIERLKDKYEECPINGKRILAPCEEEDIDEFWADIKTEFHNAMEEEFKRRLVEVLPKEYDKNCDDTDWKDGFKTGYNDCLKKTKQNIEIIYPSKVEKDITQN